MSSASIFDALHPGSALREAIIALAQDAAADIMRIHDAGFTVEHKADTSPLTQADIAAHARIVSGLERLTPDLPILSEESADEVATLVRREWPRLWLVDPLDGTREFIKRNGEFTVNIALIEHGAPVFGVVLAPVGGTVWHARKACGAYRRAGDDERRLRTRIPATAPLTVAVSRSHRDARTRTLLDRMGDVAPVALGSSLKFCRLAEGELDVYPRIGPTFEWDTAAGQCVLEAAGGCLVDFAGNAFRYNQRDVLLNGDFLALGDPALPWRRWIADCA